MYFQAHQLWAGQGPCWLLIRDICSLLHGPLHRATHYVVACFPQSEDSERKWKSQSFWNLIPEVTSHHSAIFYPLELSLDSAHTQNGMIPKGRDHWGLSQRLPTTIPCISQISLAAVLANLRLLKIIDVYFSLTSVENGCCQLLGSIPPNMIQGLWESQRCHPPGLPLEKTCHVKRIKLRASICCTSGICHSFQTETMLSWECYLQ